ncbi:hypothetical protein TNCV_4253451 [Trichonephila clavipes]|nr:hypothetical protein TNCV_4253451 [Trichonephila clavipes]
MMSVLLSFEPRGGCLVEFFLVYRGHFGFCVNKPKDESQSRSFGQYRSALIVATFSACGHGLQMGHSLELEGVVVESSHSNT